MKLNVFYLLLLLFSHLPDAYGIVLVRSDGRLEVIRHLDSSIVLVPSPPVDKKKNTKGTFFIFLIF